MKSEKKPWRLSPAIIALATAVIVIAGTLLIGWFNARRYRVNARVEIAAPVAAAAQWFAISIWVEIGAHCLGIISVLIGFVEATQLWLPFYQYNQRVTHSSARWADARSLRDLHLAKRKEDILPPFTLLLGGFGWKYDVVLGPEHSTCHLAMFGPPRSGKSSTFFITWQRAWADSGSVIVLDPKGELYDQTAHLFRNVYRIDLQNPERTDRWNFVPDCKGDAEYAHKVASMILDSEQVRRSTADPFWKEAEKAALTAIRMRVGQPASFQVSSRRPSARRPDRDCRRRAEGRCSLRASSRSVHRRDALRDGQSRRADSPDARAARVDRFRRSLYSNKAVCFHFASLLARRMRSEETLATTRIASWDRRFKGIDDAAIRKIPISSISVEKWFDQLSPHFRQIALTRFAEFSAFPFRTKNTMVPGNAALSVRRKRS